MILLAHHAKSWFGVEFEVNGEPFPDGMFDHALVLAAAVLMAYGLFALVRDALRWRRWRMAGTKSA
jgi:hypothetical protein